VKVDGKNIPVADLADNSTNAELILAAFKAHDASKGPLDVASLDKFDAIEKLYRQSTAPYDPNRPRPRFKPPVYKLPKGADTDEARLKEILEASSKEDSRYALNGYLIADDGRTLVVTDGRRLWKHEGALEKPQTPGVYAPAGKKGPHQIQKSWRTAEKGDGLERQSGNRIESWKITAAKGDELTLKLVEAYKPSPSGKGPMIRVELDEDEPSTTTISREQLRGGPKAPAKGPTFALEFEKTFPPYEDVIPKAEGEPILANIEDTVRVLRRAKIATSEESTGVVLVLNKDGTLGAAARAPGDVVAEIWARRTRPS
jgi:hypothetical protein